MIPDEEGGPIRVHPLASMQPPRLGSRLPFRGVARWPRPTSHPIAAGGGSTPNVTRLAVASESIHSDRT
jgi:hypothetical protein